MQQKGLDFGGSAGSRPARRRALAVSELTDRIQGVLETEFFDVWVEGEISNLKRAASGHVYFSLKDEKAQIAATVWKSDARRLRFRPRDGMHVLARGSVRVYPPRGSYQISVQLLEPLGKGSLAQAFEELKRRLDAEGLFSAERKRPLPLLPRRVGVISSPTGAAIRDILRVLSRRYANLDVLLYPARVQGKGAADEIARGLGTLNELGGLDVVILARGGGSLEDLWPFNEEVLARAIAASRIPTISAVGHETDYTIADFVADVRAPTPSAAAEHVVQAKEELEARIVALRDRLAGGLRLKLIRTRSRVEAAATHRVFAAERGRLHVNAQRVDEMVRRAERSLWSALDRGRDRHRRLRERAEAFRWDRQVAARREHLAHLSRQLRALVKSAHERRRGGLARLAGQMEALSPLAVLGRGYALVWDGETGDLLRDAAHTERGRLLRIRLQRGVIRATVETRESE
jgi:exodeoxyribonuclease VII large subunit